MREPVFLGGRGKVCAKLVPELDQLERNWSSGDMSCVARWVPGFCGTCGYRLRVRSSVLGIMPEQWSLSADTVRGHRTVRRLRIEFVDAKGSDTHALMQRSKPASAGGEMKVYSSSSGLQVRLSEVPSSVEAARKYGDVNAPAEV